MTDDDRAAAAASAQEQLEAADAALAEHARLQDRIDTARVAMASAVAARSTAEARLASEAADVQALESYSPTRIWASLRGRHDAEMQREEAERQQAEYFAALARAEVDREQAEISVATLAQQGLGDVRAAREEALSAKQRLVEADGGAAAVVLAGISERVGRLRAEATQLAEADAAATQAADELDGALQMLGKAADWAAWDTFGGGGAFTDAMKYGRMDEATGRLQRCQVLLARLSTELADVSMPHVVGVSVTTSQHVFDVFFDNIFSDWSVRNRIRDALAGANTACDQVREVRRHLRERRTAVDREVTELIARREELLT